MSNEKHRSRTSYRRRLLQRQTVIFGTLSITLAVLMLLCSAWWTGLLPFPYHREFSTSQSYRKDVIPCIAENTPSVPNSTISVNVYNSTTVTGLAGKVTTALAEQEVTVVNDGANWPGERISYPTVIFTSSKAVTQAYSLARMFPEAMIYLDGSLSTEVLNVVIGEGFEALKPKDQLDKLQPKEPLTSLPKCEPVDD